MSFENAHFGIHSETYTAYLRGIETMQKLADDLQVKMSGPLDDWESVRTLSKDLKRAKFALEKTEQNLGQYGTASEKQKHISDAMSEHSALRRAYLSTTNQLDQYHAESARRKEQTDGYETADPTPS